MKLTVLIDNISKNNLFAEWGLAIYIEFEDQKYLLDTGASSNFIKNAKALNISLEDVDYGILSHGHYDHGDGIASFFDINQKANFYMQETCKKYYYGQKKIFPYYIGVKRNVFKDYNDRLIFLNGEYAINDKVKLLPHSTPNLEIYGKANKLYQRKGILLKPDDFKHEQTLIFDTPKGLVVFNSCCHAGADNIVSEVSKQYKEKKIMALIGGFHLFKTNDDEVLAFGKRLKEKGVERVITGHCTGDRAFEILKEVLGDSLMQTYAGLKLEI